MSSLPSTPSSLHALFVFNPTLGDEALEARKLLYFFDHRPSTSARIQAGELDFVDLNYQKDLCGIAEGLIAFSRDFSPETGCQAVHAEKHRYAFAQPEKDYWMVLVVNNPTMQHKGGKDASGNATVTTEYLEDELEDSVLQAILHRCYSLFRLFNDSFASITASSSTGTEVLRTKLSLFMSYFLPTIRFSQLIYFTDIHGFQFLPVDKVAFLTIQYIMHLLTLNFAGEEDEGEGGGTGAAPGGTSGKRIGAHTGLNNLPGLSGGVIRNCALMYNSKLIYSGLGSDMMFLLYSLDQDLMYYFLVEYLTLKENLHLDILKYQRAMQARKEAHKAAGVDPDAPKKPWMRRAPPIIKGMYNVPESVYERDARRAENRKAFDKAQNKGEIDRDEEFNPEEVDAVEDSQQEEEEEDVDEADEAHVADAQGVPVTGAGSSSRRRSNASSGTHAVPAPYGYMTGPFRVAASTNGNTATAAAALPGVQASNYAPCINSPLIYLEGLETNTSAAAASPSSPPFANPHASSADPIQQPADASAAPSPSSSSSSPRSSPSRPCRLVVYQKYKITLFLIVEDQQEKTAAPSEQMSQLTLSPSSSSAAAPVNLNSPHPPLDFYSALESFIETHLKKLGDLLHEQCVRLNLSANGTTGMADEPYRFLYFNHMNLALKTSLSSTHSAAGSSKAAAHTAGSVLTMESIRIIRELHQDFNTRSFKEKSVAAKESHQPIESPPAHVQHSLQQEGCTEVCVRTKAHGWVVGRRATQSHREFFLLLEDKGQTLAEVQEEVDNLARTYFYNIFIH